MLDGTSYDIEGSSKSLGTEICVKNLESQKEYKVLPSKESTHPKEKRERVIWNLENLKGGKTKKCTSEVHHSFEMGEGKLAAQAPISLNPGGTKR